MLHHLVTIFVCLQFGAGQVVYSYVRIQFMLLAEKQTEGQMEMITQHQENGSERKRGHFNIIFLLPDAKCFFSCDSKKFQKLASLPPPFLRLFPEQLSPTSRSAARPLPSCRQAAAGRGCRGTAAVCRPVAPVCRGASGQRPPHTGTDWHQNP